MNTINFRSLETGRLGPVQELRSATRDRIVGEYRVAVLEFATLKEQQFSDIIASLTFEDDDDAILDTLPFRPSPSPSTLMQQLSIGDDVELADFDQATGDYVRTRDLSVQTARAAFHRAVFHNDAPSPEIIGEALMPHPEYLACTPASQSIARFTGVDPLRMDFIVYADIKGFPVIPAVKGFQSFAWQNSFDPDRTLIVAELVRRLVFIQPRNVPLAEIDAHLPPTLRLDAQIAFRSLRNRDSVTWDKFPPFSVWGIDSSLPKVSGVGELEGPILFPLSKNHYRFCRRCFVWFCYLHDDPHIPLEPDAFPEAALTHEELLQKSQKPCHPPEKCFKNNYSAVGTEEHDDESDDALRDLLKLDPDALPCDIAIITRRPCYQVFRFRQRTLQGDFLNSRSIGMDDEEPKNMDKKITFFYDADEKSVGPSLPQFTPVPPCLHKGPCHLGRATNCPCSSKKQHCNSSCLCSPECEMRWKGCREICGPNGKCRWFDSQKENKKRSKKSCPCVKARKACDPVLCHEDNFECCKNKDFTDLPAVPLQVKRGVYGLGAFATRSLKRGDFIGEYVGLVSNNYHNTQLTDNSPSRNSFFYPFPFPSSFNYMFELREAAPEDFQPDSHGPDFVAIDSLQLGNATRYLNHGEEGHNVVAINKFVDGTHRIGFYADADIEKNHELLLDYGEDYFQAVGDEGDQSLAPETESTEG